MEVLEVPEAQVGMHLQVLVLVVQVVSVVLRALEVRVFQEDLWQIMSLFSILLLRVTLQVQR
jgi:hypothetical protein